MERHTRLLSCDGSCPRFRIARLSIGWSVQRRSLQGSLFTAIAFGLSIAVAHARVAARSPAAEWDRVTPAHSGWSAPQLAQAEDTSREIGSTAATIVLRGGIVASWGETPANILLNSARKSLLSALIGIAVAQHQISQHETVGTLGIDDNRSSLTVEEKQATVRDLSEARSGVYHGANYETPDMAARRPPRGADPHGTFWYYNNWDFNALGAICEHAVSTPIFTAIAHQIAVPIGMQDFDPARCRYIGRPDSIYPAYAFYASARDLARFDLLYLRHGRWRDEQIIPVEWADESTRPYSTTNFGSGYGYLWWTAPPERLPVGSYFAAGNGGQYVFVIPADDLVIVHLGRMKSIGGGACGLRTDASLPTAFTHARREPRRP
jgi:CubicO group peptidase (beta-lactamase class C family)